MPELQRYSVTVPTTANTDNITLTGTQPFISAKTEVLLSINGMPDLLPDKTAIISVNDSVNTLPLQDRLGFNVRADRLVARAFNMPGGLPENNPLTIRVLIATDPARIVCLTPLRRSANTSPATTAGTATGDGINLD